MHSRDVLSAMLARDDVHKEFGESALLQDHVGDFLSKFHVYLVNDKEFTERYSNFKTVTETV